MKRCLDDAKAPPPQPKSDSGQQRGKPGRTAKEDAGAPPKPDSSKRATELREAVQRLMAIRRSL